MSFFRLTAPRAAAPEAADAPAPESAFNRMIRLWIEYNMRVAHLRMLDR